MHGCIARRSASLGVDGFTKFGIGSLLLGQLHTTPSASNRPHPAGTSSITCSKGWQFLHLF
jgi:hypothetical protein